MPVICKVLKSNGNFFSMVKIRFDPNDPELSLRRLARISDVNPIKMSDIDDGFTKYYGIQCLAWAIRIELPKTPYCDQEKIRNQMDSMVYDSIDTLVDYILTLESDIEKLFGIFYYEASHIEYDLVGKKNPEQRSGKLDDVFKTNKAVCGGYENFFMCLSKRVRLEKARVESFSNFSKGLGYDPFEQITNQTKNSSDHASLIIEYENELFLCEPTWGAGYVTDDKFIFRYNPDYFMIPLIRGLQDHFPVNNSLNKYNICIDFRQFVNTGKFKGFALKYELLAESNPFDIFESKEGLSYLEFSCSTNVSEISYNLKLLDNSTLSCTCMVHVVKTETHIKGCEERMRFVVIMALLSKGKYEFNLFLNNNWVYQCHPVCLSPTTKIPFVKVTSKGEQYNFRPILPNSFLVHNENEFGIIRYRAHKEHIDNLIILSPLNNNSFEVSNNEKTFRPEKQCIKLICEDDPNSYEMLMLFYFPSPGRYSLDLELRESEGNIWFYSVAKYIFVSHELKKIENNHPIYYMENDRKSVPLSSKLSDIIEPNNSFVLTHDNHFNVTIYLENCQENYLTLRSPSFLSIKPQLDMRKSDPLCSKYVFILKFYETGIYKLNLKIPGYPPEKQFYFYKPNQDSLPKHSEQPKIPTFVEDFVEIMQQPYIELPESSESEDNCQPCLLRKCNSLPSIEISKTNQNQNNFHSIDSVAIRNTPDDPESKEQSKCCLLL